MEKRPNKEIPTTPFSPYQIALLFNLCNSSVSQFHFPYPKSPTVLYFDFISFGSFYHIFINGLVCFNDRGLNESPFSWEPTFFFFLGFVMEYVWTRGIICLLELDRSDSLMGLESTGILMIEGVKIVDFFCFGHGKWHILEMNLILSPAINMWDWNPFEFFFLSFFFFLLSLSPISHIQIGLEKKSTLRDCHWLCGEEENLGQII